MGAGVGTVHIHKPGSRPEGGQVGDGLLALGLSHRLLFGCHRAPDGRVYTLTSVAAPGSWREREHGSPDSDHRVDVEKRRRNPVAHSRRTLASTSVAVLRPLEAGAGSQARRPEYPHDRATPLALGSAAS
jgi:hypothetical protein